MKLHEKVFADLIKITAINKTIEAVRYYIFELTIITEVILFMGLIALGSLSTFLIG